MTIVGISRMAVTAQKAAEDPLRGARDRGRGDRPAHAAPARPRHDPRVRAQDEPRVIVEEGWPHGGVGANLAALIQEQAFDYLDAPDRARHRRRPADAVLQAARADRLPARAAGRRSGAGDVPRHLVASGSQQELEPLGLRGRIRMRPQLKERSCAEPPSWARPLPPRSPPARWRPRASSAPVHREAPGILRRPDRGQHRRLRLHGAGRARQPDGRRELDPARGARPAARTSASSIRKARYYVKIDNTGDGHEDVAYRWQFTVEVPQPELVPVRGADGRRRSTIRTSTSSRRTTSTRRPTRPTRELKRDAADRRTTCRSRPDNVGPKTIPNYDHGAARRDHARCAAAARRSSARPTTRSSSTSARSSTASTSTSPAGRPSASATRAAARTTSRATTRTRSCCRSRRPRSRATASRCPDPKRLQRRRRRVGHHRARGASSVLRRHGKRHVARHWVQVSRLGNPLINEVIIPIGKKDKFNRDVARERREELRHVRAEPGAGAPAQRPVRPRRQGDQPDRHRPGAAHRRARTDPDRHATRPRPTRSSSTSACRRARPPNRFGVLAGDTGRLPERPPARRRRDRHRAARHRAARCCPPDAGRQADPARRRRRPERQAVPVRVPLRRHCPRTGSAASSSGRSRRTRRSRSRRPDPDRGRAARRGRRARAA